MTRPWENTSLSVFAELLYTNKDSEIRKKKCLTKFKIREFSVPLLWKFTKKLCEITKLWQLCAFLGHVKLLQIIALVYEKLPYVKGFFLVGIQPFCVWEFYCIVNTFRLKKLQNIFMYMQVCDCLIYVLHGNKTLKTFCSNEFGHNTTCKSASDRYMYYVVTKHCVEHIPPKEVTMYIYESLLLTPLCLISVCCFDIIHIYEWSMFADVLCYLKTRNLFRPELFLFRCAEVQEHKTDSGQGHLCSDMERYKAQIPAVWHVQLWALVVSGLLTCSCTGSVLWYYDCSCHVRFCSSEWHAGTTSACQKHTALVCPGVVLVKRTLYLSLYSTAVNSTVFVH